MMTRASSQHTGTARVVVAVDGTAAASQAVEVAAREAVRREASLEVLHVIPIAASVAGYPVAEDPRLREYAQVVVADASALAGSITPDLVVTTRLVVGARVASILHAADGAATLVLGADREPFLDRVWTGATLAGVAAQARCPVLVVPVAARRAHDHGDVVVAVKSTRRAGPLLDTALRAAEDLGTGLRVMHVWGLPLGYDVAQDLPASRTQHSAVLRQALEDEVDLQRAAHPDVEVEVVVAYGQAAQVLVESSLEARRLIVSRPRHGGLFHHLGSTGRAVLRGARCVIEVVAPDGGADGPNRDPVVGAATRRTTVLA